jgi:hypothetical protein
MPQLAPPEPPPPVVVAVDDDGRLKRVHFRIWQIVMTTLTLLVTAYFVMMGPIAAVLSLMIAKHVLVAILVQGLGVDAPKKA